MTIEDIKKLVEKYPNDMELGSKVREEYWSEHDKQMRELLDLPSATTNNPKGTSVTSQIKDKPDTTKAYISARHIGFPF